MKYIEMPNLPQSRVKLAVIDGRADAAIQYELEKLGIELIRTGRHTGIYDAISYHPDIVIHHIGGRKIVFAPGTSPEFLDALKKCKFDLLEGKAVLTAAYPGNVAYNVARVGNFAFHDFRYTDSVLLKGLEAEGVEFINVKQGYSKCSICIIDENSIITSDKGIAKSAERNGIEALLICQNEDILLPGLDKGFIGGSTGFIGKRILAVTGDIEKLKSCNIVKDYLFRKDIDIISLGSGPIVDMGSIIPLVESGD